VANQLSGLRNLPQHKWGFRIAIAAATIGIIYGYDLGAIAGALLFITYEAGRARWRAYEDEVLHSRLDQRSGQRPPLDTEYRPPPSFLSEVFDTFNPLDPYCGTA
jgi:hypothetical protein